MTTAPPMQRSRTQLASAYAPNSLFTFEGGAGACMAISFSGNRAADDDLRTVTRRLRSRNISTPGCRAQPEASVCSIQFPIRSPSTTAC